MTNLAATVNNIRKATFRTLRTQLLNCHADIGTKIYSSYPIKNASLPLIVISNPQKTDTEKSVTDELTYMVSAIVWVYATQSEKVDLYADKIEEVIRAARSTFDTNNLYLSDVIDNDSGSFEDINGNKGHSKAITVMFELK